MPGPPWHTLVLACFFLSGASSLVYEVAWTRQLSLILGTSALAVTAVLTAFMGGMALGSYACGHLAARLKQPLLLYGLLEIGIGLAALSVPILFDLTRSLYRWAWAAYHPADAILNLVRFAPALGILLVPAVLIGATLPVVSEVYRRQPDRLGLRVGRLYAVNTFGAVTGVLLAGFVLLPRVGMQTTLETAIVLNMLVGAVALALARCLRSRSASNLEDTAEVTVASTFGSTQTPASGGVRCLLLLVAGLSGLLAMVYEVAWTRLLTLILGSSTYAFSLMLAAFLVGLRPAAMSWPGPCDFILTAWRRATTTV